jgi:hypothetical protein
MVWLPLNYQGLFTFLAQRYGKGNLHIFEYLHPKTLGVTTYANSEASARMQNYHINRAKSHTDPSDPSLTNHYCQMTHET